MVEEEMGKKVVGHRHTAEELQERENEVEFMSNLPRVAAQTNRKGTKTELNLFLANTAQKHKPRSLASIATHRSV